MSNHPPYLSREQGAYPPSTVRGAMQSRLTHNTKANRGLSTVNIERTTTM